VTETGILPTDSNATDQIGDLISNVRSAAGPGGFVIYFDPGKWVMTSAMQTALIQDAFPSPVPGRTPPGGYGSLSPGARPAT